MKVLWISNAPFAPSGYGSQTRQAAPRIARLGHEVEFVANDGTRGDNLWNGFLVRGSGELRYSLDTVREDVVRSRPDWTVVLYDVWVFTTRTSDPFDGMAARTAAWVPVDHYPTPPTLLPWLSKGYTAIAMSRYGHGQLLRASESLREDGGTGFPVRLAPHAVDRSVMRPMDVAPGFGMPFRKVIGVPDDAFLVGIVAANIGTSIYDRKGFGDMVSALKVFMDGHPGTHVYVHSAARGQEGIDLPMLFGVKGIPADRIHWADQYLLGKRLIRDEDMAAIYSSFDLLLGTSRGEGFGLPHIEAQACGVPVILSNWTASAELVNGGQPFDPSRMGWQRHPSGWLVDVDPDYDPHQGADFGKPRIGGIIRALGEAHEALSDTETRAAMRDAALANAAMWDADAVFAEHWEPIVKGMAAAVGKPAPSPARPANRAARREMEREAAKRAKKEVAA